MLMAMAVIAALCGPRVQNGDSIGGFRKDAKQCQVEMTKCVKSKSMRSVEDALAQCIEEVK